ncbi:MAG: hypothetical protein E2O39_14310 [Planctomycetota bacterium]|nr:MAG: hypothetical protein E2O39_14310 [Planctomycetota bacterium]
MLFAQYLVVFSGLSCISGLLLAWWIQSRANQRERALLAASMSAQIQERYDAYVVLESQITRAIQQFEVREREFGKTLGTQSAQIATLRGALDDFEGVAPSGGDSAFLGAAAPTLQETNFLQFGLDGLDEKLRTAQADKQAEIERQNEVIRELTERVLHLEPASTKLDQREHEVTSLRAQCDTLRSEADERARSLEARIDELEPAELMLAAREAELRATDEEVEDLRARVRALEEFEGKASDFEQRAQVLRAENKTLDERVNHLATVADKLEQAETRLAYQESRHAQVAGEKDAIIAEMTPRLELLEPLQARFEEQAKELGHLEQAQTDAADSVAVQVELLKERVHTLEPIAEKCPLVEQQLESSQRELAELRESGAAEIQRLRAVAEELAPMVPRLEGELRSAEAQASEAGDRARELELERTGTAAQVETRVAKLVERIEYLEHVERDAEEQCVLLHEAGRSYSELEERKAAEVERLLDHIRELEPLREELGGLQYRLAESESRIAAGVEALRCAEEENLAMGHSIQAERTAVEGMRAELARNVEAKHSEVAALQEQIANLRAQVSEDKEHLRVTQEETQALDAIHTQQLSAITQEREREEAAMRGRLEALEGRLASSEESLERTASEHRELTHRLEAQTAESESRSKRIEELALDVAELETSLVTARASIDDQSTQASELMRMLEMTKEEADTHREATRRKASSVQAAKSVLAELMPMIETLELELQKGQDDIPSETE